MRRLLQYSSEIFFLACQVVPLETFILMVKKAFNAFSQKSLHLLSLSFFKFSLHHFQTSAALISSIDLHGDVVGANNLGHIRQLGLSNHHYALKQVIDEKNEKRALVLSPVALYLEHRAQITLHFIFVFFVSVPARSSQSAPELLQLHHTCVVSQLTSRDKHYQRLFQSSNRLLQECLRPDYRRVHLDRESFEWLLIFVSWSRAVQDV